MSIIRENVARLSDYRVDQDLSRIKLNQNEAPEDVPPEFKEEIWKKLSRRGWNRYPPDGPGELQKRIAAYADFPASGVLIGNGSNELILALVTAVCGRGDSVLTVKPGFSVYKRAAELLSARLIEIPLRENFLFDVPALIREAEQARLVFLASPNNPTGTVLEAEDIRKIAEKTAGLLVVDEAYYEFCGRTALPLIAERKNVVVLRTFSKAWRLAGARLGYLLGRPEFVQQAAKARLPFSVGLFAQAAAEVMLEHRERVERSARDIISERDRLFQALTKMDGIVPVPSLANFILFEAQGRSSSDLFRRLREKGILVRAFDDPLLGKHVRVTVGKAGENDDFLAALREIMEESRP